MPPGIPPAPSPASLSAASSTVSLSSTAGSVAAAGSSANAGMLKPESFAAEAGITTDDVAFLVSLGEAQGVGLPQKLLGGKFQRIEKRFATPGPEYCNGCLVSLAEAAESVDLDVEEAQSALADAGVRIITARGVPHVSRKQFADWMAAPKEEAPAAAPARLTATELALRAGFEGGAADIAFLMEQGIIKAEDFEPPEIAADGAAGEATFLADAADALVARIMAGLQPVAQLCDMFDLSVDELLEMGADQVLRPIYVVRPPSHVAGAGAAAAPAAAPAPDRAAMLTQAHFEALQGILG